VNPQNLPGRWRSEADGFRKLGANGQALTLELCASELEQAQREWTLQELTLEEAAAESGLSYSAIQKKLAAGKLPNAGKKGSPRVRRGDLPKKPSNREPRLESDGPDLAGELLASKLGV